MKTLALVTAVAATGHDDDLVPLLDACADAGLHARAVAWDDPTVNWGRFDGALLRSPWDYTERLPEFLAWCEHVDRVTRLLNPLNVVRWNTDKHYLADLATVGISTVPTCFVEPDAEPMEALGTFLDEFNAAEFVVKPTVSAGARDTQRYFRDQQFVAGNHIGRLLEQERSVMLQPYLASVDQDGETALLYFGGRFSHAARKSAQLAPGEGARQAPMALGGIVATTATPAEQALAERILTATARLRQLEAPLAYARIDLLTGADGQPCLLELELTEPSLFFAQAPGSAARFAAVLAEQLTDATVRARMGPA
ncbi:ATP-grasp domain-containing protein [Pseudoxanthomonas mexicana]